MNLNWNPRFLVLSWPAGEHGRVKDTVRAPQSSSGRATELRGERVRSVTTRATVVQLDRASSPPSRTSARTARGDFFGGAYVKRSDSP